jgi:hypothetical protein
LTQAWRLALLGVALGLAFRPGVGAVNTALTDQDLARAVAIAKRPDGARSRFHETYSVAVEDATVQSLDVVTEFRRAVLTVEEQLGLGNWFLVGGGTDSEGRKLVDLLRKWKDRISIRAQIRFHPQNPSPDVSAFDIAVGESGGASLLAIRTPQFAVGDQGVLPPPVGALIECVFESRVVGQARLPIRVMLNAAEIKRVQVDFSRLE